MWNDCKSVVLSKICVLVFLILLLGLAVAAPFVTDRLISISRSDLSGTKTCFLLTKYLGQVFIMKNVVSLRHISWCCFLGAAICLVSALYYFPWALVGVAAAFMGLIVRVVKNVFARAVSLQDDADFTI